VKDQEVIESMRHGSVLSISYVGGHVVKCWSQSDQLERFSTDPIGQSE